MKDNLYKVCIEQPSGRRVRNYRLLGGKFIVGKNVTMTKDVYPFVKERFCLIGFGHEDGKTPLLKVIEKK
jgi:hypothetical protein